MPLLRRRSAPPDPQAAIADFWAWWGREGAAAVDAAIEARDPVRESDRISRAVAAVHPGLDWELGPGTLSRHQMVVSAGGDHELRAVARQWLRAAPAPDEVWEYADLRQPAADLAGHVVSVGGRDLPFSEVVVTARRRGPRFDVTVFHPLFADVDDHARLQLTFLALDAALGEADVETWVGEILPAAHPPMDAFPLEHLRGLVVDLAAELSGDDGEPSWSMLQGEGPRGPVLVMARTVLAPVQAPDLDRHVAVSVPFADRTEAGFPAETSLQALRDLEDHLVDRLGSGGRLLAHATQAGVRTLHFYVDGTGPGEDVLRTAADGWRDGAVSVTAQPDPGWQAVAPFRG